MLRRILGKVKRTIFPPARFGRVELNRQTTLLGSGAAWTVDPTLLNEGSIVYGVGVGEDITFDLDLIKHFGCTVEAMDPTPKSIQYVRDLHPPEKFRMHPWGLAARDGELTFYPPTRRSRSRCCACAPSWSGSDTPRSTC